MQLFVLIFMIALALTMWGRSRFLKIYGQEAQNTISSRITGAELAEKILRHRGIEGVSIIRGRGILEDFYYPDKRQITLAAQHFSGSTFTALAMASQQAGKAIQHFEGHRPLLWRTSVIYWTVYLSLPLFIVGLFTLALGMTKTVFPLVLLAWSIIAVWNIMTVPTELDAGARAKKHLEELRVFKNLDERVGVERVMGAACTAYIDGLSVIGSWAARHFLPGMSRQDGAD
ncbi:MAG: zinc metallopeptidase [Verrucomicrobiales bacterium]